MWFLGWYAARQKNRSHLEGFLLGFWLGPFGVLIEWLLPKNSKTLSTRKELNKSDYVEPRGRENGYSVGGRD